MRCAIVVAVVALGVGGCCCPSSKGGDSGSKPGEAAEKPVVAEADITMAKYNQIKTGMSYRQVVGILGKEGTEVTSNKVMGITTVMYQWDAGFMANMNATFQNDKLMSKAQLGLK